jgi:hypothetical protein
MWTRDHELEARRPQVPLHRLHRERPDHVAGDGSVHERHAAVRKARDGVAAGDQALDRPVFALYPCALVGA